jgi:Raf kinase inhibitor-like YbhB/YbcL family protein
MSLSLESPAFNNNSQIPQQYSCDGKDVSPALSWQHPPQNTKSYVLIVDDPDAPSGNWVHWVLFNIPAQVRSLASAAETPVGAVSGRNSWGQSGYRGPCPPNGTHRYLFKLYALDTVLYLDSAANKQDVMTAMKGHILETTELRGSYTRNRGV